MISLFAIFWYLCTSAVVLLGLLIIYFEDYVPRSIREVYLFGKLSRLEGSQDVDHVFEVEFIRIITLLFNGVNIRVPKRWFQHFYVFAVLYFPILLKVFWFSCITEQCYTTQYLLNIIFGRTASNTREISLFLALAVYGMAMLHFARRCYECAYISVFSHSTISALHYLIGYVFYASFGLVILNLMVPVRYAIPVDVNWYKTGFGVFLYLFGSYFENQSLRILRQLRVHRNSQGSTHVSHKHFLPTGGFFNLVSCPHYFSEILIYFGFYFVTNCDSSWLPLLVWVCGNQTVAALLTHKWYQKTFKNLYPKNRRALIPFIL